MRLSPLVILTAAACAAQGASSGTDVQAVRSAIDSLDLVEQRWLAEGKLDSIVNGFYASDAVFMTANAPAAKGTEAIRAALAALTAEAAFRIHFKGSSLYAADSLASEQGEYSIEVRAKTDTTKVLATDHGNYVTTFIRRNGQWRAVYDISSSDVPAPAPAASAAPPAKKK